ncbi:methyltransferase domain-containing protein [Paenibacillus polymyxa]|uniref:class I SAM-dependent methyltransferase n=1 Tax=Paenibacillus polymyxa TaxID=1406 RepID=UPI0008FC9E43|nr:class I SAM-dependent methyltransferase [Paenibacillus polymyxa]APB69396.1 methyltransferase domain-containing protein [Paenibacillus polymyxa]
MSERFYPTKRDISYYEHFHRYLLAKIYVEGKKVLDIACGEGYGSHFLSQKAKNVTAVDVDSATIEAAKQKYINNNLTYLLGDINELDFEDKVFDVIVCYETIEHVQDPYKAFNNLKRVLKDDGILIISTPNKAVYSDEKKFSNPFHIKEFYYKEYLDLLRTRFESVHIYGQRVLRGSYIWDLEVQQKSVDMLNEGSFLPMYFIAVCSGFNGVHRPAPSYFTDDYVDYEIDRAQKIIEEKDKEIDNAKEVITSSSEEISLARLGLKKKETEIEEARTNIDILASEIDKARKVNQEKSNEVESAREAIEKLSLEIDKARRGLEEKDREIENARIAIENLLLENENARRTHLKKDKEIENAKTTIDNLVLEIDEARTIINTLTKGKN